MKILFPPPGNKPGPFRKVLVMVFAVLFAVLILTFSAVFFVVALIAGAMIWGWFWWKTRALRKQMQMFSEQALNTESEVFRGEVYSSEVIEGEAVRVEEPVSGKNRDR